MKTKNLAALAVVAVAPLLLAPSCNDVVQDPTFRLWCGDNLCAWKTEKGSIRRAPTWHEKDYGVELVDTPTVISQDVGSTPRCLTFTAVADVEPSAQVTIGLDFNRDGTIDNEQPIAATGFREAKTEITAPRVYDGIRFVISKKGTGRAVLAEIRVQNLTSNCVAPATEMKNEPIGTPCGGDSECKSGVCCGRICAECCASNPNVACKDGGECKARANGFRGGLSFMAAVPLQCDAGKKKKAAGGECIADDDCASGHCEGARTESAKAQGSSVVACAPSFPDAGGEGCLFTLVSGGSCR